LRGAVTLSPGQKDEYEAVFKMFDQDGNGVITKEELKRIMETIGFKPTDQEIEDIIISADSRLNFDAMISLMTRPMGDFAGEEDSLLAFNCYDKDGDKYISRSDLQNAMFLMFGDKLNDDDLLDVMKECDRDNDGRINYDDFSRILLL